MNVCREWAHLQCNKMNLLRCHILQLILEFSLDYLTPLLLECSWSFGNNTRLTGARVQCRWWCRRSQHGQRRGCGRIDSVFFADTKQSCGRFPAEYLSFLDGDDSRADHKFNVAIDQPLPDFAFLREHDLVEEEVVEVAGHKGTELSDRLLTDLGELPHR